MPLRTSTGTGCAGSFAARIGVMFAVTGAIAAIRSDSSTPSRNDMKPPFEMPVA